MTRYDIAIAGAGPGGLAAALALHRQGHRITLYEQFEAPKPLGSGLILQPTGLGVLEWLGLAQRMKALGARIDRLSGTSSGSGRTVLDVRYDAIGDARGYAVHRAALFNVLYEAVLEAGISIETSHHIRDMDDGVLVLDQGRSTPRHDLVIDALGARSPLRRWAVAPTRERQLAYGAIWASLPWPGAPFDEHALQQRYEHASVMIGVMPIGRTREGEAPQCAFFWSLKVADHAGWVRRGLDAWKQDVMQHWPETAGLLQAIRNPDDMVLARYQHHTMPKPYGNRLVCIGDSAHSTSPQLGQGANNALLDVRALADAMAHEKDISSAAVAYAARRRLHVRSYQALSAMFTPFYQSDSRVLPALRDRVVAQAARIPMARRFLAHMVSGTVVPPLCGA